VCSIYSIPAVVCFHLKSNWGVIKNSQLANDRAKVNEKNFEKQGVS
jgi:hypothetical protein